MKKFEVGQHIVWNGIKTYDHLPFKKGDAGTVMYVGNCIHITWDSASHNRHMVKMCGSEGGRWYSADWELFSPAPPAFTLDKPVRLRQGRRPIKVTRAKDEERPYRATVKGLLLSFDPHGQFYPGFKLPIDLVNK